MNDSKTQKVRELFFETNNNLIAGMIDVTDKDLNQMPKLIFCMLQAIFSIIARIIQTCRPNVTKDEVRELTKGTFYSFLKSVE